MSVRPAVMDMFYRRSAPGTGGCSPRCPDVTEGLVSKSVTKELRGHYSAERNRGIMRFSFPQLRVIAAFVTDMDTMNRRYSNRTVVPASIRLP